MLSYIFNGLVFVLLGLQLRHMLAAVQQHDPLWLAGLALSLWALLVAMRMGWVWASAHVRFRLHWGWAGARTGPEPAPHVPGRLGRGARLGDAGHRAGGADA